jgi:hypothetical protein
MSGALLFFPRGVSRAAPADISPIVDFQSHFKEIAKQHSPEPRRFYVHLTSVIVRFSQWRYDDHHVIIVFLVTGNPGHCCHTTNSRRRYLTCKPPTCGSSLIYIELLLYHWCYCRLVLFFYPSVFSYHSLSSWLSLGYVILCYPLFQMAEMPN